MALGHYLMMQAAVKHMKPARIGRIVNVTSVTGVTAAYSSPAYTCFLPSQSPNQQEARDLSR